jgi:hypothetical protein
MNLNNFARTITLAEGGKKSISIGQVKECLKLTFIELCKYDDKEILKTIHRYKKYLKK